MARGVSSGRSPGYISRRAYELSDGAKRGSRSLPVGLAWSGATAVAARSITDPTKS